MDFLIWSDKQIKGKILHKLTRKGKFEHSHTALDNIHKGFPPELQGLVKATAKELIKEGILHLKKTNYGKQISLNLAKTEEIMQYIDAFLNMD